MKKLLSLTLVLAMVFACVSMVSFGSIITANAAAAPDGCVGIRYSQPASTYSACYFRLTGTTFATALNSELVDGRITKKYVVYNQGTESRYVKIYFQGGDRHNNEDPTKTTKGWDNINAADTHNPKYFEGSYPKTYSGGNLKPGEFRMFYLDFDVAEYLANNPTHTIAAHLAFRIDVQASNAAGTGPLDSKLVDGDLIFFEVGDDPTDSIFTKLTEAKFGGGYFFKYVTAADVPARAQASGDLEEEGLNGWEVFSGYGGAISVADGGANGSAHSIHYDAATSSGQWASIRFDITPSIIYYPQLGLYGGGPGWYQFSFYARSDEEHSPDTFGVTIASQRETGGSTELTDLSGNTGFKPGLTNINMATRSITPGWDLVTVSYEITETLYNRWLDDFHATGLVGFANIGIRLDGSTDSRAFGSTRWDYYLDDFKVQRCNAVSFKNMTTADVASTSGAGILVGEPVVDGTVTKGYYIYNSGTQDIYARVSLYVYSTNPSAAWVPGGTGEVTYIPVGKAVYVKVSCPVEDGNLIPVVNNKVAQSLPLANFWTRLTMKNASGTAATDYVIWTDRESDMLILKKASANTTCVAAPVENVDHSTARTGYFFRSLYSGAKSGVYNYHTTVGNNLGFSADEIASFIEEGMISRSFTVYNCGANEITVMAQMQANWTSVAPNNPVTIPAGGSAVLTMSVPISVIDGVPHVMTFGPDDKATGDDITDVGGLKLRDGKVVMKVASPSNNDSLLSKLTYRFDIAPNTENKSVLIVPHDSRDIIRLARLNNITAGNDSGWATSAIPDDEPATQPFTAVKTLEDSNSLDSYGTWGGTTGVTLEGLATGGYDGGFAVKATMASAKDNDRYGTLVYDLAPAVFPADFAAPYRYAQYNGAGVGRYTVSFWARLDTTAAVTKTVVMVQQAGVGGGNSFPNAVVAKSGGLTRDCNRTIANISLTNSWKYYSLTFTVQQDMIDALAAYACSGTNYNAQLLLRFDGSQNASLWNNGTPIPYLVDEITIRPADEKAGNDGLKLTVPDDGSGFSLSDVLVTANGAAVTPVAGVYAVPTGNQVTVSISDPERTLTGLRIGNTLVPSQDGETVTFTMPAYAIEYEVVTVSADATTASFVADGKVCAVKSLDEDWTSLPTAPNRVGYRASSWTLGGNAYTDAAAAKAAAQAAQEPVFTAEYTRNKQVTITTDENATIYVGGVAHGSSYTVDPMTIVTVKLKSTSRVVDGQSFAGWLRAGDNNQLISYSEEYAFYMLDKDVTLTPFYTTAEAASAIQIVPEVRLRLEYDEATERLSIITEREVPVGMTVKEFGILLKQVEVSFGSFDETTLVKGGAGVLNPMAKKLFLRGTYVVTKKGVQNGDLWAASCYVVYEDTTGTEHTVKSVVAKITAGVETSVSVNESFLVE